MGVAHSSIRTLYSGIRYRYVTYRCGCGLYSTAIGLASMTVPMYLAECSPVSLRGRLTALNITAAAGGQFVAGVVDFALSYVPQGWRYMLGAAAIPAVIDMVAFLFLPESPRWLVSKGKYTKASIVLRKVIH